MLLCGLDSSRQNVYFQKSGRGNAPSSLYSPASSTLSPQGLLFLHAVSGCDTTSAPYGMGKKRVCSLFNRTPSLSHTHTDRRGRGKIPGGPVRRECYLRSLPQVVKPMRFQLAKLPPTSDAAKYHSFRVYHQVQAWLGMKRCPWLGVGL